jgi:hypothetical protein|tara:strand:+ start:560 stop:712 length:153 start_codon:yes stop_codon:yes gene_type:complete
MEKDYKLMYLRGELIGLKTAMVELKNHELKLTEETIRLENKIKEMEEENG